AARMRETVAQALEGEKLYESILDILGFLKPEAVPVFVSEVDRSAQWVLKCELIEGLGVMGAKDALSSIVGRETGPVFLSTALYAGPGSPGVGFMEHTQWQVRLGALTGLRQSRSAVGPLVGALSQNDLRFRKEACESLRKITGTELPMDVE